MIVLDAPRIRRTQAERKAQSDARMVLAATELFAEQGCVRTTLQEVGARAGYTGGLVSKRFGSKAGLVKAVLDDIYERFRADALEQMRPSLTVRGQIETYVRVFLGRITRARSDVIALYVVLGESVTAAPELRDHVAGFTEHTVRSLAHLIEDGIARHELRADLDSARAATVLLAVLRGVTFDRLARPEAVVPEDLVEEVLHLISNWTGSPPRSAEGRA